MLTATREAEAETEAVGQGGAGGLAEGGAARVGVAAVGGAALPRAEALWILNFASLCCRMICPIRCVR